MTTAIVSFAILHFLSQGDPRYVSRYFNPVFNPMWRPGISNGLAIPYAVCINVRTALTSSATSLSEQSVPAAWASPVEACLLRSRSVRVDWRAFGTNPTIPAAQSLSQFHIWRHNDIFPIAGLGTYISGVGIHLQLRGLILFPSLGTHRRLVNHHTPGLFGLGSVAWAGHLVHIAHTLQVLCSDGVQHE